VAATADAENDQLMAGNLKILLFGHDLLLQFDMIIDEFLDPAATGTNQMIVMCLAGPLIAFAIGKLYTADQAMRFQRSQTTVYRGNTHAVPSLGQGARQFFRLPVMIGFIDQVENNLPMMRQFDHDDQ